MQFGDELSKFCCVSDVLDPFCEKHVPYYSVIFRTVPYYSVKHLYHPETYGFINPKPGGPPLLN